MPGALDAGQIVDDRYALRERIGEDALGTIWRAHDRGLEREIVLRAVHFPGDVFRDDPRRRQTALTAARKAIKVDHPRAVHVYDAFVDGEVLMMVTEVAEGRTLASLVEKKPLLPKRAAAIGLDLLDALEAAHAVGVVHGAVSPRVVLVPDKGHARLTGFGLAPTYRDASSTMWIEAAGTPACVAPEQANLQGSGESADLWALGATLYRTIEGVHAFSGPTPVATLVNVAHEPPRPAERGGELAPILERLLSREPRDRPGIEVVRAVLTDISGIVKEAPETPTPRRRTRRERSRPEPETPPEQGAEAGAEPEAQSARVAGDERDWTSVIEAEETWVNWPTDAPIDASDIWLPGSDDIGSALAPPRPAPDGGLAPTGRLNPTGGPAPADPATAGGPTNAETRNAETRADDAPAPDELAPVAAVRPLAPQEAEGDGDQLPRYRSTPSWPPPPKRRVGLTILCGAVSLVMIALLMTEGRVGRPRTATTTPNQRPVLASDPSAVPSNWITWRHPAVPDFGLAYPPGWSLREEGSVTTIRDPASGAEMRVDYKKRPSADPLRAWEDLERGFSAQHPTDYKRLQLSPASFQGHVAALWEFTFAENNVLTHAVDVGFLTKDHSFALYFQAPAGIWTELLPTFHSFLGSVRAPK